MKKYLILALIPAIFACTQGGNKPTALADSLSAVNENIKLYHYPDISKPREYLNLLEIGVKEDPTPRNLHYLCREYWYLKKWEDCIKAGLAHLNTIGKGWLEEYPVSMRYIATAYKELGNYYQSEKYYY